MEAFQAPSLSMLCGFRQTVESPYLSFSPLSPIVRPLVQQPQFPRSRRIPAIADTLASMASCTQPFFLAFSNSLPFAPAFGIGCNGYGSPRVQDGGQGSVCLRGLGGREASVRTLVGGRGDAFLSLRPTRAPPLAKSFLAEAYLSMCRTPSSRTLTSQSRNRGLSRWWPMSPATMRAAGRQDSRVGGLQRPRSLVPQIKWWRPC